MLHLGQTSAVAVVEQKTAFGARHVLAQVALGTPARFPTFDNLFTVTVGTLDRNERHGPLLTCGRYQDEAQCDINRRPSPLLEHYPLFESARRALCARGVHGCCGG